jgi:hypothetical protein
MPKHVRNCCVRPFDLNEVQNSVQSLVHRVSIRNTVKVHALHGS